MDTAQWIQRNGYSTMDTAQWIQQGGYCGSNETWCGGGELVDGLPKFDRDGACVHSMIAVPTKCIAYIIRVAMQNAADQA